MPDAPVASPARVIVMSTRPGAICWVKVAFAPADRMKLPSCTLRTRSSAGSKVSVSETVDRRETFTIEIGIVYGPAADAERRARRRQDHLCQPDAHAS